MGQLSGHSRGFQKGLKSTKIDRVDTFVSQKLIMFCTLFYSKWCPFVLRSFSYGPRAKNDYKWGNDEKMAPKLTIFEHKNNILGAL